MFWDSPSLPFVRHLEEHYEQVRAEARALRAAEYAPWPDTTSYTHGWRVFGLFSRERERLSGTCDSNARRCPATKNVLRRIPGLRRAGFSMLEPGAHIFPHADNFEDRLRCHLPLWTNELAGIRFDGVEVAWEPGRCLVFDGSEVHEAANFGAEERVVFLVDLDSEAAPRLLLP